MTQNKVNKRFIYLISPIKIKGNKFYKDLSEILNLKKVSFFQLRLKKETKKNKLIIGKKIRKICKTHKVKFLINDDPFLAKKLNADGCHLGQMDMNIKRARKLMGYKKIIGVTCHNSKSLVHKAVKENANYIALGSFFESKTKKIKYRAKISTLRWCKNTYTLPIVTIGGINDKNYKKLLLNSSDFLAISGYIWNNKKLKPRQAIQKLKR